MVFEKLHEMVELQVKYTAKGTLAIHAGGSQAFTATDNPVVMIGGQPVIPGSSLKGALRMLLEATLSEEGIEVCLPEAAIPRDAMRRREEYARDIGRIPSCDPSRKQQVCAVCDIFGAMSLSGRAMFLDARPVGEVKVIERTHVAITRDNKPAAGGKLLQQEAVDAGAVFAGTIRVVNPQPWQIGALLQSLESLSLLGLGSKKTSGYGEVDVKVTKVVQRVMQLGQWQEQEIKDLEMFSEAFQQFLLGARRA